MFPFDQILAHLPDGVVVTNAASEILWANAAYGAITGYTLDELVGRTPLMFRSPDTDSNAIRALWDNLGASGVLQTRLVNRRKDGSLFQAALSLVRLNVADESLFVCTTRDVSVDAEVERRLSEMTAQAVQSRDVTIYSLASMAEQRDKTTGTHLQRIEAYTRRMAAWIIEHHRDRLPPWARDAQSIARCSILHDIGKVGIPDSILAKDGPLTADEQRVMRDHTRLGTEIIDRVLAMQPDSTFLRLARDIIACHHEAWDASGYPAGLAGDSIPLVAQLVTVADVFDALTSARPYKPAHRVDEAAAWIVERRGRQFGPLAVDAFIACLKGLREVHVAIGDTPTDLPVRPSGMASGAPVAMPEPRSFPHHLGRTRILDALAEGLASRLGGEVVVRSSDEVGRIQVRQRRIAWAHVSGEQDILLETIRARGGVSDEDLRILLDECKRTGRNVLALLEEWSLMPGAALREIVREHIAARMQRILSLPSPVAMFVPQASVSDSPMSFGLEELLPGRAGERPDRAADD